MSTTNIWKFRFKHLKVIWHTTAAVNIEIGVSAEWHTRWRRWCPARTGMTGMRWKSEESFQGRGAVESTKIGRRPHHPALIQPRLRPRQPTFRRRARRTHRTWWSLGIECRLSRRCALSPSASPHWQWVVKRPTSQRHHKPSSCQHPQPASVTYTHTIRIRTVSVAVHVYAVTCIGQVISCVLTKRRPTRWRWLLN